MISIILFLSTALLTQGLPSSSFHNVSNDDTRIIEGSDAKISEFPHQVSIQLAKTSQHNCGGSIISPKTILTAAHCVDGWNPKDMKVMVGSDTLNAGGTTHMVDSYTKHEKYNTKNYKNDIAVIILKTAIKMTSNTQQIALSDAKVKPGEELQLSGFGATKWPHRAVMPNKLQKMTTYSVSMADCKKAHKNFGPWGAALSDDTQVCTLTRNTYIRNTGACKGDSGGPLINKDKKQVGITSWGNPCAKPENPDVFTLVSAFIAWITKHTKK